MSKFRIVNTNRDINIKTADVPIGRETLIQEKAYGLPFRRKFGVRGTPPAVSASAFVAPSVTGYNLTSQDLDDIYLATGYFGSGGGGGNVCGASMVKYLKSKLKDKPIKVIDPGYAINLNTTVLAYMGAPTAMIARDEFVGPTAALVWQSLDINRDGTFPLNAVIPVEIGPINTFTPMIAAQDAGLPVVDGDGVGRAIPVLEMALYNYIPGPAPVTVTAETNTTIDCEVSCLDSQTAEAIIRPLLSAPVLGEMAAIALWSSRFGVYPKQVLYNTLLGFKTPGCLELGRLLRATPSPDTIITYMTKYGRTCRYYLFNAAVTDIVETSGSGGFDFTNIYLEDSSGNELIILSQNEFLLAWDPAVTKPVCMCPDLISIVDSKGNGYTAMDVQKGNIYSVIFTSADPTVWGTQFVLDGVGPVLETLGYYGPLQQLS